MRRWVIDLGEYTTMLQETGERLGRAAARCGLDAPVPTCEGWTVGQLLAHIGGVHRWAASYVTTGDLEPSTKESEAAFFPAVEERELLGWYEKGHAHLVAALRSAPPGLSCWSFLPAPSPLVFWARRQAHETAIHCADAELAAGLVPSFPAAFALDGIDELLNGFFARDRCRLPAEPPVTLAVCPNDAAERFAIRLGGGPFDPPAVDAPPECAILGSSSALYLALWNRDEGLDIEVSGDRGVLETWRKEARVLWT